MLHQDISRQEDSKSRSPYRERELKSRSPEQDRRERRRSLSPPTKNSHHAPPPPPRYSEVRRDERVRNSTRDAPPPSMVLGVFGFGRNTTEQDLKDEFRRHGDIEKVIIINDKFTGKSRGFGFVTYKCVEDASAAKNALDGFKFDGREIRVDYSFTKMEDFKRDDRRDDRRDYGRRDSGRKEDFGNRRDDRRR